jgi:hypothetical protein
MFMASAASNLVQQAFSLVLRNCDSTTRRAIGANTTLERMERKVDELTAKAQEQVFDCRIGRLNCSEQDKQALRLCWHVDVGSSVSANLVRMIICDDEAFKSLQHSISNVDPAKIPLRAKYYVLALANEDAAASRPPSNYCCSPKMEDIVDVLIKPSLMFCPSCEKCIEAIYSWSINKAQSIENLKIENNILVINDAKSS